MESRAERSSRDESWKMDKGYDTNEQISLVLNITIMASSPRPLRGGIAVMPSALVRAIPSSLALARLDPHKDASSWSESLAYNLIKQLDGWAVRLEFRRRQLRASHPQYLRPCFAWVRRPESIDEVYSRWHIKIAVDHERYRSWCPIRKCCDTNGRGRNAHPERGKRRTRSVRLLPCSGGDALLNVLPHVLVRCDEVAQLVDQSEHLRL